MYGLGGFAVLDHPDATPSVASHTARQRAIGHLTACAVPLGSPADESATTTEMTVRLATLCMVGQADSPQAAILLSRQVPAFQSQASAGRGQGRR